MGIAMAHFDLSADELELTGNWKISEPEIESIGLKYIVTWKGIQITGNI